MKNILKIGKENNKKNCGKFLLEKIDILKNLRKWRKFFFLNGKNYFFFLKTLEKSTKSIKIEMVGKITKNNQIAEKVR